MRAFGIVSVDLNMLKVLRCLFFVPFALSCNYSKTCAKRPLKNRQNKGLNDNW